MMKTVILKTLVGSAVLALLFAPPAQAGNFTDDGGETDSSRSISSSDSRVSPEEETALWRERMKTSYECSMINGAQYITLPIQYRLMADTILMKTVGKGVLVKASQEFKEKFMDGFKEEATKKAASMNAEDKVKWGLNFQQAFHQLRQAWVQLININS